MVGGTPRTGLTRFRHFAAIDWSGAAGARQQGIALACCQAGTAAPDLLLPAGGWSRAAILDWLRGAAAAGTDMLIGLDLSPALPLEDSGGYFPGWPASPHDAKTLWALIDSMSRDDPHFTVGTLLRDPHIRRHFRQQRDCGDLFPGGRGRLRVCEERQRNAGLSPSSCFNLVGAAQVGKSSLTGMRVLHQLNGAIPVWPFDPVPDTGPVIVEIYTTIAARAAEIRKGRSKMRDADALDAALVALGSDRHAPLAKYDDHVTDAILTSAWLRTVVDCEDLWHPPAMTPEIALTEGWTFGVV